MGGVFEVTCEGDNCRVWSSDGKKKGNNECFVLSDRETSIDNIDSDPNTWGKCLPPPLFDVLDEETAKNMYLTLKTVHDSYCTHFALNPSEEYLEAVKALVDLKGEVASFFSNTAAVDTFASSTNAAITGFVNDFTAAMQGLNAAVAEPPGNCRRFDTKSERNGYLMAELDTDFDPTTGTVSVLAMAVRNEAGGHSYRKDAKNVQNAIARSSGEARKSASNARVYGVDGKGGGNECFVQNADDGEIITDNFDLIEGTPDRDIVADILTRLDINADGQVTAAEAITYLESVDAEFDEEVITAIFAQVDVDGSGGLDAAELAAALEGNDLEFTAFGLGSTSRGNWGKCIPHPLYGVLEFETSKDFYILLKEVHDTLCTHFDLDLSVDMLDATGKYLTRSGMFSDRAVAEAFQESTTNAIAGFILDYQDTFLGTLKATPADPLGDCSRFNTKSDKNAYLMAELSVDFDEASNTVTVLGMTVRNEHGGHSYKKDAKQFSAMCGNSAISPNQQAGGACLWMTSDLSTTIPADQQGGFDNTDPIDGILDLDANGDGVLTRGEVLGETGDFADTPLIDLSFLEGADPAMHCHMALHNSGLPRVQYFQPDLERYYSDLPEKDADGVKLAPGYHKPLFYMCFCDYRHLGNLVDRCDCTKNGAQNNNCGNKSRRIARETKKLTGNEVSCNNC